VSYEEQTLLNTLTTLSERMKWVIRIGGTLICILMAGYAYQVNINLANATNIEANTTQMEAHIIQADQIHKILIENWIKDNG
jgi:hypothetical protein